ncbi:MAG: carboxypeptidase-like regulatory domain-containing protein [Pyrinomonadaceae bacterium]
MLYDVATSAAVSNPTVCFNVPSFSPAQFSQAQIFHLEANQWQNRTAAGNTYPTLCTTTLASLSPFAIVASLAPTAASVTVSGRVVTAKGRGIFRAQVSLTDSGGETRRVYTNPFGFYRFDDVPAGETYIISANHRFLQFTQNAQVRFIGEDTFEIDFLAQ